MDRLEARVSLTCQEPVHAQCSPNVPEPANRAYYIACSMDLRMQNTCLDSSVFITHSACRRRLRGKISECYGSVT